MTTDIFLQLVCAETYHQIEVTLWDQQSRLVMLQPSSNLITLTSKIVFPNQLKISLVDANPEQTKDIQLNRMIVGSLEVPVSTLDQICFFQPKDQPEGLFVRRWWTGGSVTIDLFTRDWIQWHLTYGHKILP